MKIGVKIFDVIHRRIESMSYSKMKFLLIRDNEYSYLIINMLLIYDIIIIY